MMQTFINTHPGSPRTKEATEIIDASRRKLETKDASSAKLYYDLGQYRAAAVTYASVVNTYPESERSEEYKMMVIKSYFRYDELSVEEKKAERYEKVIEECNDFRDRFPQSQLSKEVQDYLNQSQNNLKIYSNEPVKKTT